MIALVALSLTLAIMVAWILGANDAANSTATVVGGGVISLRRALTLFSIFVFLGATTQGYKVIKTIGRGIVPIEIMSSSAVIAAALAAFLWLLLCTWKGIPVSTTHTSVGAVLGFGLIAAGVEKINFAVLMKVFISWAFSPLIAMVISLTVYKLLEHLFSKIPPHKLSTYDSAMRLMLIGVVCFTAYSFGANDVANAVGIFDALVERSLGTSFVISTMFLSAIGALGIILGGFTYGHKVISTIGFKITKLSPLSAFTAQFSMALTVLLFTTIPHTLFGYGMPISTTHSIVGAVIGVGIAKGVKSIDRVVVTYILASWALTVPIAATLAIVIYLLFNVIFGVA
ncbi:MAG: inorganic phosphate transporter [Candidatus Methanomethylicota archaeon]|uniref:Inorganic phosphate transporter n=1 Tax=Thermoproteota archaeon TaxID=2056631 RepID=A0A497ESX4_9CREN|nr:MAG: inorganic phosphate transporter [Candidatus Verstraetearchaeota archaeon]